VVAYVGLRSEPARLLASSRAAICQWWHSCMNFERLAGSEPRRCFGDMVSSSLIAALRFTDGRFIVVPYRQELRTTATTRGLASRQVAVLTLSQSRHSPER
jgi:hypothetical protein